MASDVQSISAEASSLGSGPEMRTGVRARHRPNALLVAFASWGTEAQILLASIVLALFFALSFPDSFATYGTLMNMARVAGILLVVSIGQTFALVVGGFDISVGATMGLVSIICSLLMVHGVDVPLAIAAGIAVGAAVGLVNGIGVAALRITPFVMTLGMLTFARGLADQLGNGGTITGLPRALSSFGRGNWGMLPSAACIAVIVLVAAYLVLQRCRAGLYIFSLGGSRETTRVAGVQVVLYEALAYVLCGALAGCGGVMLTARVSVGQGSLGQGYELLSIATAVIGGVAIGGGSGRLTGVVLGVVLITLLTTGLDIGGVNPFVQQMVTGLVLVIAVLVSKLRGLPLAPLPRLFGRRARA